MGEISKKAETIKKRNVRSETLQWQEFLWIPPVMQREEGNRIFKSTRKHQSHRCSCFFRDSWLGETSSYHFSPRGVIHKLYPPLIGIIIFPLPTFGELSQSWTFCVNLFGFTLKVFLTYCLLVLLVSLNRNEEVRNLMRLQIITQFIYSASFYATWIIGESYYILYN